MTLRPSPDAPTNPRRDTESEIPMTTDHAAKHTPGPWSAVGAGDGKMYSTIWAAPDGRRIADTSGTKNGEARGTDAANARLIAAAPDRLAELERLIQRVCHYAPQMDRSGDLEEARAAIAKALGAGEGES